MLATGHGDDNISMPYHGLQSAGMVSDDAFDDGDNTYRSVLLCVACQRVHQVNPRSSKVFGVEQESRPSLDLGR
jgi:hypothetical protein